MQRYSRVGRRHALLAASMAVSHAGRRALGGRHLVEAPHAADLKRIATAWILDGRSSDAADRRALTRIVSSPRTPGKR